MSAVLFNANTRSAYQAGFYDGAFSIGEVLEHGDFGLGALERNDGELVILDGRAWRTAEDGSTHALDASARTPYATVLRFARERTLTVSGPLDKDGFERFIGDAVQLDNRIWALRISGRFDFVVAGASGPQSPPYRPLAEVFATYTMQRSESFDGTLVAFACPVFLTGVDFVGFHYHLLSDDHEHGGHVTDLAVREAEVALCEATSYSVALPDCESFRSLSLGTFHGA
jgi:acetolactate decarboxylase